MNLSGTIRKRQIHALAFGLGALGLAYVLGRWILSESSRELMLVGLAFVVGAVGIVILKDWRTGFYLFFVWLLFEDLARKYLGNNMIIYFGKDFLVGLTYLSFFADYRRRRVPVFRPPFLVPFSLFFWLCVLQIFNFNSPSVLYGPLGIKLDFYYVPLMFVGYALLRNEEDLRKFFLLQLVLGTCIAALGLVQSVVGLHFLNPATLAPELRMLGRLRRVAPISGDIISAPTSVFVSSGRFSFYVQVVWILAMGLLGYLLLRKSRRTWVAILALGVLTVAAFVSGSRTAVISVAASAMLMSAGFLWGAPSRWQQRRRLAKTIRTSLVAGALALLLMSFFFPETLGANWSYLSETLSPQSSASELSFRAWDYPVMNLLNALDTPHWLIGYGTGTCSLGAQYMTGLLHLPPPLVLVESGYGALIVELGILGPILWLAWVVSLLVSGWNQIRQLRHSPLFPIGLAILWYAALLLLGFTFLGYQMYQNYVLNAFLWTLVGVMFRLPSLARSESAAASAPSPAQARWSAGTPARRWGSRP